MRINKNSVRWQEKKGKEGKKERKKKQSWTKVSQVKEFSSNNNFFSADAEANIFFYGILGIKKISLKEINRINWDGISVVFFLLRSYVSVMLSSRWSYVYVSNVVLSESNGDVQQWKKVSKHSCLFAVVLNIG